MIDLEDKKLRTVITPIGLGIYEGEVKGGKCLVTLTKKTIYRGNQYYNKVAFYPEQLEEAKE